MRFRVALALAFALLPAFVLVSERGPEAPLSGVALGRQVYVREGCIHCHSQFVRANTPDEIDGGASADPERARRAVPALIGNRRQGPDLMHVGQRLPREWHRLHLMNPRQVVPTSRMPAYPHLFADGDPRGEALLDYLVTLGRDDLPGPGAPGGRASNAQRAAIAAPPTIAGPAGRRAARVNPP